MLAVTFIHHEHINGVDYLPGSVVMMEDGDAAYWVYVGRAYYSDAGPGVPNVAQPGQSQQIAKLAQVAFTGQYGHLKNIPIALGGGGTATVDADNPAVLVVSDGGTAAVDPNNPAVLVIT